jgi:hypothetical protein
VDLTLYGHYHSYQRTCPVYQNKCVDDGLVHITVGSAGAWLDLVGFYDVRHPRASHMHTHTLRETDRHTHMHTYAYT